MQKGRSIRWHLFQVQLVSIVPLGIFAALMLYLHWQVQDEQRQHSQIQTVRLLAAAVDNSLDSTVERLAIFARLWSSSSISEEAVYHQARSALAANQDWSNILAFDANGRGVFRVDAPFGSPVPESRRFDVWRPVFEERRPVVSDVLDGVHSEVVAVGVPVVIGERVQYVLVAALDFDWYDRLLNKQGQVNGAVAALLDRNYRFVARSIEGDQRRGTQPAAGFVSDIQGQREGIGRYVNLNGTPVYTTWTYSRHGWGVTFATPSAPVDTAFWNHLLLLGLLLALALGAGTLYAFAKARPIARSLYAVEGEARHLARGGAISALPDSRVEEVNRALRALEQAGRLLQDAMAQRDRSLATEREARAAAEAANNAKDEFLAMLGHELRNPLAAISNAITIAGSEQRTPEQLEFAMGVIARQSRHLKRLIDDLLDVGRVMNGKIALERRPVNLASCARQAAATLRTAGRLAERRVEIDAAPVWVVGDPTRLEQVLANLLANAARHTAPGGTIRITTARENGEALIRVEDDGEGIPPEVLSRVFDLFFQGESTADRSAGGLGIGLTLVERIVALHGGEVSAESEGRGRGATFVVRLPAVDEPVRLARPERAVGTHAALGPVLVVEDNADARESLAMALELRGVQVLRAENGAEALATARRAHPALAVLDIGLPGMNGYDLARHLRKDHGERIRLVAVTGYGAEQDQQRSAAAGIDRHFTKPVDVDELIHALEVRVAASGERSRLP
ncbi:MAG TPA: ATP-binding protein [Pseudomonadales bacterium]